MRCVIPMKFRFPFAAFEPFGKRFVILCFFMLGVMNAGAVAANAGGGSRPNFIVILADDLGFSDLGCYGSEIETPNLDSLANKGVRFTQFYNTAKCHSSRISLMSGRYPYQAGGRSLRNSVTIPEMLRSAGYRTLMTGKWHLNKEPTDFGFDRYFGHLSGSTNYFVGDNTFRLNGKAWEVPKKGFYTTVADVEFALKFLNAAASKEDAKPWFLYLAFNAPHAPLQPLEKDYRKYLDRYAIGWDEIRKQRVAKQRRLGLFPDDLQVPDRPDHIPAWNTLSEPRRDFERRRMAAYAGMIDRMDHEIGRLLDHLRDTGELENTLVLFLSDNGACPYDRRSHPIDAEPYEATTSWSDSTGWAWARNTPFRYYKQNQFEGGITTPAILHWPAGLKLEHGSIRTEPLHLVDVLPTLSRVANAPIPSEWPDRELNPVAGRSFAPILRGETMGPRAPLYFLYGEDRAVRDGAWKLVSFRSNPWELYDLETDRTELHDLADEKPQLRDRLAELWMNLAEFTDRAPGLRRTELPTHDEAGRHVHPQWTDFSEDPSPERMGYGRVVNQKENGDRGN